MSADLLNQDATELAAAIKARKVSSVEVTEACLGAAQRLQPALNCFIRIDGDQAIAQARAIDAELAKGTVRGVLAGVPLAHKDMYYRAGEVTTCGSKIRRDFKPPVTATALERLSTAGALNLGTLNMAEFAFGPTGHNAHFGACRNPWDTARVTGGSSSGSGSGTAARIFYGALGSDTGGSIRLPAHLCGLAGLKPTWSLVSRAGAMPLSFTLDTVGPLARTVRDVALLTQVIAGHDPRDATSRRTAAPDLTSGIEGGVKGLKIGVPQGYFDVDIDPEIAKLLSDAHAVYQKLGATVVAVKMPDLDEINALCNAVILVEAATAHGQWLRTRPQDYGPQVLNRLEFGMFYPGTAYLAALDLRAAKLREFDAAVFGKVDALLTPVVGRQTPTIAETDITSGPELLPMLGSFTRFTRPINYLGLPGLGVPAGFTKAGMPCGFQLVGKPFSEAMLCRAGRAYERETQWYLKAPQPRAHAAAAQ
ncbi:MAG: amidase [Proteobacteria bacterium]|nr:amidase [Pseudomonadota bacterium]